MAGPKHPRHFTEEFKRQVVGLHNSGKPAHGIMAERDLRKPALRRRANATNATDPSRAADNRTPEESRLIEPEHENGRLGESESVPFPLTSRFPFRHDGCSGGKRGEPWAIHLADTRRNSSRRPLGCTGNRARRTPRWRAGCPPTPLGPHTTVCASRRGSTGLRRAPGRPLRRPSPSRGTAARPPA